MQILVNLDLGLVLRAGPTVSSVWGLYNSQLVSVGSLRTR